MKKDNKDTNWFLISVSIILSIVLFIVLIRPLVNGNSENKGTSSNNVFFSSDEVGSSSSEVTVSDKNVTSTNGNNESINLITMSEKDNVSVSVSMTETPFSEKDEIDLEIAFSTHSVNLDDYLDLKKYIQLETNMGFIDPDAISWESEGEGHHFGGILKINNLSGSGYIIDENTEFLKVIVNNVVTDGQRVHLYMNESEEISYE